MDYASNIALPDVAERLLAAKRPIITTHAKPDGDAYGSVIALAEALRLRGAAPQAYFMPPLPAPFETLHGRPLAKLFHEGDALPAPGDGEDESDLLVILDTGAWSQVAPMQSEIEKRLDRTIIIDHHLKGDIPAMLKHVEPKAAACCEVIADLLDLMSEHTGEEYTLNPTIREALFVGIASDTGWFRFSNTRPRTHEWAARLIRDGVDQAALYEKLEQGERPEKLALMIRALDSLQWLAEKRAALMVLRAEDFEQTGAMLEETERFVDLPRTVQTVQVVAMVTEPPPPKLAPKLAPPQEVAPIAGGSGGPTMPSSAISEGESGGNSGGVSGGTSGRAIRISFRSKSGAGAVNVSDLAAKFGGGGHARAAGAKVEGTLDEVAKAVSQAMLDAFA